ncbi:peptidylglycine alpha-hydroxylating monooxygenase-like [Gigantopelta aegis]|uniref:peptidylglycine alpha-hydroxylating monooxygenase-like n=1 Tax=Gigantopelta aegis TaxID=1735272 RepID=UPI001B88E6B4|nr:peptidylglycine alpha-hydroxylating monooxygenase-like [Gigantopelta aegis]
MGIWLGVVVFVISGINTDGRTSDPSQFSLTLRMPDVSSHKPDALLCHAVKLDSKTAYVLKYEPHASRHVAHHLMVYGCGQPGNTDSSWSCDESDDMSVRSVCGDGARKIVYAWALDADSVQLPKDVGFRVSGSTGINYMVLQLHYVNVFKPGQTDNSGVTLRMTYTPQPKQAGFYVLGNMGFIPPQIPEFHMESACYYKNLYPIYPIGYRTHSHNLGVVTSGYRIRNEVWTEIGRMSPQLPETFYNTSNPGIDIRNGDILACRCTMNSMKRTNYTVMGPRNIDEMCNFYILYYTYQEQDLKVQYCFQRAQNFRWKDYLPNIPTDASSLDGIPGSDVVRRKFGITKKSMDSMHKEDLDTM